MHACGMSQDSTCMQLVVEDPMHAHVCINIPHSMQV